jgi:hypothetical protein
VVQALFLLKNPALAIFAAQVITALHLAPPAAFPASRTRFLHSLAQFRKNSVEAAPQGLCLCLELESALSASLERSDHTNQLRDAWVAPPICFQLLKLLDAQFVNQIFTESPRTAEA